MNRKTVITKINTIGAMRRFTPKGRTEGIVNTQLKNPRNLICSDIHDPFTTYVRKLVWNNISKDYLFPPYVECEYVE